MSTSTLTPAEHYWILVHAATSPHINLAEPRFSAGAVLLTLRDLQAMRCLAPTSNGRLVSLGGVTNHTHASKLLLYTFDKELSEKEWVETLCLSPTARRLCPLLNELSATVARQLGTPVVRPPSLLRMLGRIDTVDRSTNAFMHAALASLAWITSRERGCAEALRMLELAGAIRPLARSIEGAGVREEIAQQRGTALWRSCDDVVFAVENAQYMNATLSGTM